MSRRLISTRNAFVIVCVVTLILLVGPVVLSRIVFKAVSPSATLYFSQSTISAKPETSFSVSVLADLSAAAEISGVQLEVNFDPKILKPAETQPAALWRQVFSKVDGGKLSLVMLPLEKGTLTEGTAGLSLASLTFTTLSEGRTNLSLTPTKSLLAVYDGPGAKGMKSVVESVVDAQVRVISTAKPAPADSSLNNPVTPKNQVAFSSQRIISTAHILAPDSAVILVRLEHPARISVAFGPTASLGNRADYSAQTDQAAVRIGGLDSGKRYFYQVFAENDSATNRVLGQVKSFELPVLSSANSADRAELTIFPSRASSGATAYAVFYDRDNKVISGLSPRIQADKQQVSITKFSELAGMHQSAIDFQAKTRQIVRYSLTLDDKQYASVSALFDPSLADAEAIVLGRNFPALNMDERTMNFILILVGALLVLGVGFYKLSRAR